MKGHVLHIHNKLLLSICINLFSYCLLIGQSVELQIVTKQIHKKINFEEGQILLVEGEKSDVKIMTWEKDYISIDLELKAQHPEKAVAKADLEKFIYSFITTKDSIFIRNKITAKEETLRSGLQAHYVISIPTNCKLKLNNYFGSAELTDLPQGVDINSEFCNLKLNNILGKIDVQTYFGDLIGVMINGKVNIKANRSNVTLSEIEGDFNIDAYMGVVKVFANESLLNMKINAIKSDVFFYDTHLSGYNFDLTSKSGNVELPADLEAQYSKENEVRSFLIKPEGEFIGVKVAINVVSGDIMLGSR